MTKLSIEFRLIDLRGELQVLEEHLLLAEKYLPKIIRLEQERLLREWGSPDPDSEEFHIARYEGRFVQEELIPRLWWNPFIVSLWAVYEAGVVDVAEFVRKQNQIEFRLSDVKGEGFLKRAKKYYRAILQLPLHSDENLYHRITIIADLRNAIAHANGRMEMVNDHQRSLVQQWAGEVAGVSLNNGYLVLSESYLKKAFEDVRNGLTELIERVLRSQPTSGT